MCELCCKLPGEGEECKSSFSWNEGAYEVPNLYAKPGSPCRNYTGYCDSYHNCREVDPSGPLATLRKLLLADEGLTAIADWVDNHWYAVMSFVALFIVMMVCFSLMIVKIFISFFTKYLMRNKRNDMIFHIGLFLGCADIDSKTLWKARESSTSKNHCDA